MPTKPENDSIVTFPNGFPVQPHLRRPVAHHSVSRSKPIMRRAALILLRLSHHWLQRVFWRISSEARMKSRNEVSVAKQIRKRDRSRCRACDIPNLPVLIVPICPKAGAPSALITLCHKCAAMSTQLNVRSQSIPVFLAQLWLQRSQIDHRG